MALAKISGNCGIQNVRGDDLITKLTLTLPQERGVGVEIESCATVLAVTALEYGAASTSDDGCWG
jgi:hypothetical protein